MPPGLTGAHRWHAWMYAAAWMWWLSYTPLLDFQSQSSSPLGPSAMRSTVPAYPSPASQIGCSTRTARRPLERHQSDHLLLALLRLQRRERGLRVHERPLVRRDETQMKVEANMYFACHPEVTTPQEFMTICDNFLVKADGTQEHLHKFPQEVIEI